MTSEERLFVYGTLAPGRPNGHVLAGLDGRWEPASVAGRLIDQGWGATLGFPGLVLDGSTGPVQGWLFTAAGLAGMWPDLDRFEGEGYRRVVADVTLASGGTASAQLYVIADAAVPGRPGTEF